MKIRQEENRQHHGKGVREGDTAELDGFRGGEKRINPRSRRYHHWREPSSENLCLYKALADVLRAATVGTAATRTMLRKTTSIFRKL